MADNPDNPEQHYQPEQTGMYELEFPAPQLSSSDGRGPVMIHALEGFSDAGHAIHLAAHVDPLAAPFRLGCEGVGRLGEFPGCRAPDEQAVEVIPRHGQVL